MTAVDENGDSALSVAKTSSMVSLLRGVCVCVCVRACVCVCMRERKYVFTYLRGRERKR